MPTNIIIHTNIQRNLKVIKYSYIFNINRHAPSRLEQDGKAEAQDAIRNLVLMLASLTMCGHIELKPSTASMGSLFQMLNFTLPQPSNRGIIFIFKTISKVFHNFS
jgi:hypothetical protein